MPTFTVLVRICGDAYFDVEADDANEAVATAAEEWASHISDMDDYHLNGVGWLGDDNTVDIAPV